MRARNIKPGFFKNEDLAELSMETRMLFIGLWLLADREGRLDDRPKRIKAELFAFENIDVDSMLNDLQSSSFLIRYVAGGKKYIQVENFVKHQDPHYKEKKSEIPPIPGREDFIKATGVTRSTKQRILERDDYKCQECGATDGLCIDHIIPASRGGDSSDDNLQVLCISCNTKKGNRLAGEDKGCKKSKHDSGSVLVRSNVDPTLIQRNRSLPSDSLIPDSLIPDSLIPDSGLLENTSCPEPLRDSEPEPVKISSPVVLTIPIKGKAAGDYEVTEAAIAEWQEAYPAVDVPQALRSIRQWNLAHPDRQKTRKGVVAHIVGWLDKEQNRPRHPLPLSSRASPQQSPIMSDKTIRSMNNLQDWVQQ